MKLLLENWRKYITETEEPITTLRIFDFDETTAHTRSETRVTAPDGSTVSLGNQKEFEDYAEQYNKTRALMQPTLDAKRLVFADLKAEQDAINASKSDYVSHPVNKNKLDDDNLFVDVYEEFLKNED